MGIPGRQNGSTKGHSNVSSRQFYLCHNIGIYYFGVHTDNVKADGRYNVRMRTEDKMLKHFEYNIITLKKKNF